MGAIKQAVCAFLIGRPTTAAEITVALNLDGADVQHALMALRRTGAVRLTSDTHPGGTERLWATGDGCAVERDASRDRWQLAAVVREAFEYGGC